MLDVHGILVQDSNYIMLLLRTSNTYFAPSQMPNNNRPVGGIAFDCMKVIKMLHWVF